MPQNNAERVPQLVDLILTKEALSTILRTMPGLAVVQVESTGNFPRYVLTPKTITCQTIGTPESEK